MHRHKIVAQILLTLSIFNSVLAATVVTAREIPGAVGAVAVRRPAEGVVAVLEKRPNEIEPYTSVTSTGLSPEHPGSLPTTGSEHSGPLSTQSHGHSGPQSMRPPVPEEVFYDASSAELKPPRPENKASSNALWRQKIITPEKKKAGKYAGIVGLLTVAYLGLLLPEIVKDD